MLSSPAKRRKVNASASVDVNHSNTNLDQPAKPTTPTRASYLSPTKASLARSHPHLAQQNQRSSLTEPRGRRLKDDLLKAKSTSQSATVGAGSKAEIATNTQDSGEVQEIAQERTHAITTSKAPRTEPRLPLQSRQPSVGHPATSQDFFQPPIVPKLVRRFDGSTPARRASPLDRVQPTLPPTPVELGWQEPPERPKGLSSSSPRGSRSGSARQTQRLREGQSITSSPSKPNDHRAVADDVHDQESEAEMSQDEPQLKAEVRSTTHAHESPREIVEKQTTLKRLKADLAALKTSFIELERALNLNEIETEMLDNGDALKHAIASVDSNSSINKSFEQLVSDGKEAAKYVELFAPANLQLSSKTSTKMIKNDAKIVQHLTVTAPLPWPPHIFTVSFDVITDAETATVENIIWTDTLPGKSQSVGVTNELFDWLDTRLGSHFHGCNVGVLIWGLGQYFEKAIQRAIAFWNLSAKYHWSKTVNSSGNEAEEITTVEEGQPLREDQTLALTRYLTKSQITFELPATEQDAGVRTRRDRKAAPKIMVNWKIDLSWNGATKNLCKITPSGIPDSAVQSIEDLFETLYPIQGFEAAFEAVYELVKGQREATPATASTGSRQGTEIPAAKAKGRKRMRFT